MGEVHQISDYQNVWKEIFVHEDEYPGLGELHVYVDNKTGELEIFQMSAAGGGARTCLTKDHALDLLEKLKSSLEKK